MKNISASDYLGSASELEYHINCALRSLKALSPLGNKEYKDTEKALTKSLEIATKNKLALLKKAKGEPVYP